MKKDLGYRKVQRTGRGSYIISLPKDWILNNQISKGSELAFQELDDSSLMLVPRKVMESKKTSQDFTINEHSIYVDSKSGTRSVCQKIISLYVVDTDLIHIIFKEKQIPRRLRHEIKKTVKELLLGSEIINETSDKVDIQILIRHPEFSVEKAIRRMTILALSANEAAISALVKKDQLTEEDIEETINDVERLNLYVVRQLKFGLERNLFKELGFENPKEFLGYRIVTNDIKSIANNARIIIRNIATFKKMIDDKVLVLNEVLDEEIYSQIRDFNFHAQEILENSMNALFRRNYEEANNLISKVDWADKWKNDLVIMIYSKKIDPNISSIFNLMLDNSRRIIDYARNISEVTLNRSIEKIVK